MVVQTRHCLMSFWLDKSIYSTHVSTLLHRCTLTVEEWSHTEVLSHTFIHSYLYFQLRKPHYVSSSTHIVTFLSHECYFNYHVRTLDGHSPLAQLHRIQNECHSSRLVFFFSVHLELMVYTHPVFRAIIQLSRHPQVQSVAGV